MPLGETDDERTDEQVYARRRTVLRGATALGAVALAGCSGSGNPGDTTTTSTETTTETATPTETETSTETETTTEEVELPQEIDPELSDVNAQIVYVESLDFPANYNRKMATATHEETDIVGLTQIAEEFEGDRVEQVKNVAAAAAAQYTDLEQSNLATVKAVHELDWFSFKNGARADLETMIGDDVFSGAVFTYEDDNGELRKDMLISQAQVTRPSRDWVGPYNESNFMKSDTESAYSAATNFDLLERAGWNIADGATERFKNGQDNFLWGARHDGANLVFSREGGLRTAERLKESPEVARDVKDEVNKAYAEAEMEGFDLDENYLAVEAEAGDLSYSVVTEAQAEEIVWT